MVVWCTWGARSTRWSMWHPLRSIFAGKYAWGITNRWYGYIGNLYMRRHRSYVWHTDSLCHRVQSRVASMTREITLKHTKHRKEELGWKRITKRLAEEPATIGRPGRAPCLGSANWCIEGSQLGHQLMLAGFEICWVISWCSWDCDLSLTFMARLN